MGRSPFLFLYRVHPHTDLYHHTRAVFLRKCSHISISFTCVGWCHFWWSLVGMSVSPLIQVLLIVTKMSDFVSQVENLGYCFDFTTKSQENLLLFYKFFIYWLIKSVMFFVLFSWSSWVIKCISMKCSVTCLCLFCAAGVVRLFSKLLSYDFLYWIHSEFLKG